MERTLEKNKGTIAFIIILIGYCITVIATDGAKRFLIAGVICVGLVIIAFILIKFSKTLLIMGVLSIVLTSVILFIIVNKKENRPVIEKTSVISVSDSASIPSLDSAQTKHENTSASRGKNDTVVASEAENLVLNELSVNEKEGFYRVKGIIPTFAKSKDGNRYMKIRFGFSNPTNKTFYIKRIRINIKNYERLNNYDSRRDRVIDVIAVTFKTTPSETTLKKIKSKYDLEIINSFDELFTFRALKPLDSSVLGELKKEREISQIREASRGTGHGQILFTSYRANELITPASKFIFVETDEKLSGNDLAGIELILGFSSAGKYNLECKIIYGDNEALYRTCHIIIP